MSGINFKALAEPFPASDIEWRLQSADKGDKGIWARCLAYVTNRAIQNRLDEVCGPENWKNEFQKGPDGGILCGLSIKCDGEWITKWDGAENTDIEGVKGGLSGSMKRAAVMFGIGRYLYNLEEGWAKVSENGKFKGKTKGGVWFKWDPPSLPAWALPKGTQEQPDGQQGTVEPMSQEQVNEITLKLEQYLSTDIWDRDEKLGKKAKAMAQDAMKRGDVQKMADAVNYCKKLEAA